MSAIAGRLGRRLADLAVYAYRTLVLFFLLRAVIGLLIGAHGRINEFIVFLILSCGLVPGPAIRRLRRIRSERDGV